MKENEKEKIKKDSTSNKKENKNQKGEKTKKNKKNTKTNKMQIVKISTISLAIILIAMISFFGIYTQKLNKMKNGVKQYSYAMDLNGARTVTFVNTGTEEVTKDADGNIVEDATDEEIETNGYTKETVNSNSEDVLTIDNYNKTKDIIEKRLKKLGVEEYNTRLNENTGEIAIEIAENDKTDEIISDLTTIGKFEIIDSETKEVLMDNNDIKSSEVLYNTTESGTSIYLQIGFNKEGKQKLRNLSNTYKKTENTTSENSTTNEVTNATTNDTTENTENTTNETDENTTNETTENSESTTKKITMKIDDEEIMTTSFDEELTTGKLQLSIGSATTDTTKIQEYGTKATSVATVLESGNLPIEYEIEGNEYILSEVEQDTLIKIEIIIAIVVVLAIIVLILKYKLNGVLVGIAYLGLASIFMLIIRYTNVLISMESILGICLTLGLNYIFLIMLLKNIKKLKELKEENVIKKATKQTYMKFILMALPVYIMSITFCFMKWTTIATLGMVIFWGITLIAIYNILVTKPLLKIKEEK